MRGAPSTARCVIKKSRATMERNAGDLASRKAFHLISRPIYTAVTSAAAALSFSVFLAGRGGSDNDSLPRVTRIVKGDRFAFGSGTMKRGRASPAATTP